MIKTILFLDLGGGEIMMIFFIILLLFGAKRIPEFARGMGKGLRQLRNATDEIQSDIQRSVSDVKRDVDVNRDMRNRGNEKEESSKE